MSNSRIEFIDLAKGIFILLIVFEHVGLLVPTPGLYNDRLPIFFVLSGLFFKCDGIKKFIVSRTNRILVPFIFFYLLGYLVFYVVNWFVPGLIVGDASGILDVFTQRQYFNGPIWFLLALFWANLMFCGISIGLKREWMRVVAVLAIGACGVWLGREKIMLPCVVDSAMSALPFFYFGYLLKKTPLLEENRFDKYNILFVVAFYAIAVGLSSWFDAPYIGFHYNNVHGNVVVIYLLGMCGVMAVLYLCKVVKRLPIVSYCGRYSIILLCTHHLFYRPIKLVLMKVDGLSMDAVVWITAVVTVALCCATIPLCKRYIPKLTAQEDLIVIGHRK